MARAFFPENPFKQHYLDGIPANEPVTLYRCGSFIDLCRGPHVRHTGQVCVCVGRPPRLLCYRQLAVS